MVPEDRRLKCREKSESEIHIFDEKCEDMNKGAACPLLNDPKNHQLKFELQSCEQGNGRHLIKNARYIPLCQILFYHIVDLVGFSMQFHSGFYEILNDDIVPKRFFIPDNLLSKGFGLFGIRINIIIRDDGMPDRFDFRNTKIVFYQSYRRQKTEQTEKSILLKPMEQAF